MRSHINDDYGFLALLPLIFFVSQFLFAISRICRMSSRDRKTGQRSLSSSSIDYNEETWVPNIKRRRRFTTAETRILENEFKNNSSPNQEKIQCIANSISTPRKIVTTWFQNRRAKNKRKEKVQRETEEEDEENYADDESCESNYVESNTEYLGIVSDNDNNQSRYYMRNLQKFSPSNDAHPEICLEDNTSTTTIPFLSYFYNNRQNQYTSPTQNSIYAPENFTSNSPIQINSNQLYNINIVNNMNNYFIQQEQQYGTGINELIINNNDSFNISQQQLFNMLYCQQFSPFHFNNYNFPSQPSPSSENDLNYINPADLCLNSPLPQRHQQQKICENNTEDEHDD